MCFLFTWTFLMLELSRQDIVFKSNSSKTMESLNMSSPETVFSLSDFVSFFQTMSLSGRFICSLLLRVLFGKLMEMRPLRSLILSRALSSLPSFYLNDNTSFLAHMTVDSHELARLGVFPMLGRTVWLSFVLFLPGQYSEGKKPTFLW